jgi:hypothetical protein
VFSSHWKEVSPQASIATTLADSPVHVKVRVLVMYLLSLRQSSQRRGVLMAWARLIAEGAGTFPK